MPCESRCDTSRHYYPRRPREEINRASTSQRHHDPQPQRARPRSRQRRRVSLVPDFQPTVGQLSQLRRSGLCHEQLRRWRWRRWKPHVARRMHGRHAVSGGVTAASLAQIEALNAKSVGRENSRLLGLLDGLLDDAASQAPRDPLPDIDEVSIKDSYGLHWRSDETADEFRRRVAYVTGGSR